ncbi:MAG TPA: hypothetical protein VKQ07_10545 [Jatrophihabitantaceae bacterium]|nr:hypothetical protein [Jatrophihabitantaceae bacterium]
MSRFRATTPQRLVGELAEWLASLTAPGPALRVAVDGAPVAQPVALARSLVDPLRERGRPTAIVAADTFWRDASLRLEYGREDVDAYLEWLDAAALQREVLDPLGAGGSGQFITSLRDPRTNRATRAELVTAGPGAIVVVAGALLFGRGLPFDATVHLSLTSAALRRRTDADDLWTLVAFEQYERTTGPQRTADVLVRVDDPARPAIRDGAP